MTATVKRMTLGFGAGLMALTAAAGVFVQAQDQTTPPQPREHRGRGGPGEPGGPGRFGGAGGPMGMLPMLGPEIGLTDAQRDQIKTIVESHRADWRALGERARTAHLALNDAVTASPINEALIRQKSSEVAAVEADMAVARAHAYADVAQILTPEQKERVKTTSHSSRS